MLLRLSGKVHVDPPATRVQVSRAPLWSKRRQPNRFAAAGDIREGRGVNGDLVQRFVEHGFVKVEQAFPADAAESCAQLLWAEIGVDAHDRGGRP
jgi:hypothetical protein